MMPFLTKGKIGGGGIPARRNNNRLPQSPSHCLPPAADHAASWRCDFDGRSIPLPPPAPQHATQSIIPVRDCRCARGGEGDGRGAGGPRIANPRPRHMRRREDNDDDDDSGGIREEPSQQSAAAPREGEAAALLGEGESGVSRVPGEELHSGGAQTTISRGWGSQPPRQGRGGVSRGARGGSASSLLLWPLSSLLLWCCLWFGFWHDDNDRNVRTSMLLPPFVNNIAPSTSS